MFEDNIYIVHPGSHRVWFPEGENQIPDDLDDFDNLFEDMGVFFRNLLAVHPASRDGDHGVILKAFHYLLTKGKNPDWMKFKYHPETGWSFNRWLLNGLRVLLSNKKKTVAALISEMEMGEAYQKKEKTLERRLKKKRVKIIETKIRETEKEYYPEPGPVFEGIDFTGGDYE